MQNGNIAKLHIGTGRGNVFYGKIESNIYFTGTGNVCNTVTLQRYMFGKGMELSAVWKHCKFTFFYRDWNCLHYGKIAKIHAATGNANVCITATLQSYMFVQGVKLHTVR